MRVLIIRTHANGPAMYDGMSSYFAVELTPELCKQVIERMSIVERLKREDKDTWSVKYNDAAGDWYDYVPFDTDVEGAELLDIDGDTSKDAIENTGSTIVEISDERLTDLFGEPVGLDKWRQRMVVIPDEVYWLTYPRHTSVSEETDWVPRCVFVDALKAQGVLK